MRISQSTGGFRRSSDPTFSFGTSARRNDRIRKNASVRMGFRRNRAFIRAGCPACGRRTAVQTLPAVRAKPPGERRTVRPAPYRTYRTGAKNSFRRDRTFSAFRANPKTTERTFLCIGIHCRQRAAPKTTNITAKTNRTPTGRTYLPGAGTDFYREAGSMGTDKRTSTDPFKSCIR